MRWVFVLALLPTLASAESLVATRPIRAQSLITPDDVALVEAEIPGALADPSAAIGQEARVTIYAGRPIRLSDLGAPALVERNQVVTLSFLSGVLQIATEGRALDRGGVGDVIKVMNLASHTTVLGVVGEDGTVVVAR